MKKIFRRLACCSFLSIASIGCFDAEARVTKEVAEAVLPYLMEAAGIEGDQHSGTTRRANKAEYENNKIQAILNMIYTDDGQQQMVNRVKTGKFPQKFRDAGFASAGTYADDPYRKVSLASLFPCSAGTFTSFANHQSRLGLHILLNEQRKSEHIASFLRQRTITEHIIGNINFQSFEKANTRFHGKRKSKDPLGRLTMDTLLAKVIFVLDIVDDKNILELLRKSNCLRF